MPTHEKPLHRLLHLEDNSSDANLIFRQIREEWPSCEVTNVVSRKEFSEALRQEPFDLILSDFSIPGFDGMSALAVARDLKPEIPFIFLSGTIGEESAVEALTHGSTDYILKDRPARLVPAIRRALHEAAMRRARQTAEAAVQEAAARFNQLADVSIDIFLFANLHPFKITYVSPSVEMAWGIPPEAIRDEPNAWLGSVHPDDRQRVEQNYNAWLAGKRSEFSEEYRVVLPDHSTRWIFNRGAFGRDAAGKINRMSCVARDVTAVKESVDQSLRAQRLESIGLLAGGIAHDLNNALAPVLMGVELLREAPPADSQRILAQMETSAKRGAAMVRQLLGFARGAEGQRVVLEPGRLLREVEQLVTSTFPKSIALVVNCPDGISKIEVDSTLLYQVLVNLCVNARDAMPGGGTLTLEVENTRIDESYAGFVTKATPGDYVAFKVTDTGAGIPPELLQKIFDPFFTTKPAGVGTGLGLTTVAGIAHNHGGFVRTYSEVGKGSCFKVFFPVVSTASAVPFPPRATPLGFHGHGALILVVDDDEPARMLLKELLERVKFEVITAADGTEALSLFAAHHDRVKLVITDERMPYMDGSTLVRALRHMSAHLPIIAMSGLHNEKRIKDFSAQGVARFLHKPFSLDQLAEAIRGVLESHTTQPELPLGS